MIKHQRKQVRIKDFSDIHPIKRNKYKGMDVKDTCAEGFLEGRRVGC